MTMEWIMEKYHLGELKGRITNYRRMSELMMVLFFILLYIFLKTSEIPPLNLQFTKTYREIDITKIAPERIKLVRKHEIPMPKALSHPEASTTEADQIENVDSELLTRDVTSLLNQQPPRSLQRVPEQPNHRPLEFSTLPEDVKPSIQLQQSREILKDNATQLLPSMRVEPNQVGPTVAINENVMSHQTSGRRNIYPNKSNSSISDDKLVANSGKLDIPLISKENVRNRTDLSVIIDDLMEWMKKHPAQFIPVVRNFMMYEAGDLTSKVIFSHRDRKFELYLLYKPNRREIRVCLVEGHQSTMLIDSGFKRQSNYLRIGDISRSANGDIFAFSTTQLPATEEKTMEFYQVFLTWWDQAKLQK